LSLEETARRVGVSAANLSRTERGLSGGVHLRHLDRVATVLGTSVSGLHVLAEVLTDQPELLNKPSELAELTNRLAHVQRAYLRVSAKQRDAVDGLLGI
jgi:transcriptional regulator with XRE-family HTH domain